MDADLKEGLVVGGTFVLVRPLGAGGAGEVWLASDKTLGRDVAVKFCRSRDDASAHRFLDEARALASVRHPGVVPVLQFGTDDATGRPFFAMPVFKSTLKERLGEAGRLPENEVASLGISLLDAIAALHEAGVVHRDIKPSNILLDDAGKPILDDPGPAGGGTREWAAPEQLSPTPNVGAAADFHALGLVLYRALTGELPPPRGVLPPAIEPPAGTLPRDIRPRPSHAWEGLLVALLKQDPATRLADATAIRKALRRLRQISRLWKGAKYAAPVAVAVAIVIAIVAAEIASREDTRPPLPDSEIAAHVDSCPPPLPNTLSSRSQHNEKNNAAATPTATTEQKTAATTRNKTKSGEVPWYRQVAKELRSKADAALFPVIIRDGRIVVPEGRMLLWGDLTYYKGKTVSIVLDGGTLLFSPTISALRGSARCFEFPANLKDVLKPEPPRFEEKGDKGTMMQNDFPILVTDKGGHLDSVDLVAPADFLLVAGPMRPDQGATNAVLHVLGKPHIILNRLSLDPGLKVTGCGQVVDIQPDGRRTNHRWFDDDDPLEPSAQ